MNGFDLLTASIGLAASALAAALLLPLWRRAPVPAYRLAVSVLAAALALPLLQWGARSLDLPVPHPARRLALALGVGAGTRPTAELNSEPQVRFPLFSAAELLSVAGTSALDLEPVAPLEAPAALPRTAPRAAQPWPWQTILLGLWAAGALWALANTARRLLATRRLFARARPVEDAARRAVWDAVRASSRVGARTRLYESDEVRTPACAGLWRPAVVLPADDSLAGRPELLACVLTHELVHLERRDTWVLVGEELLRAAFWFHPAAWWLVARLGALRELSCDCLVVRRTGKRKRYASALVEYATWMQGTAPRASWAAVVPWSESRGHLTRRIEMLLQPQSAPQSGRFVAPAAVGVLMTFLWSGQLALATSSCAGTRGGHEDEQASPKADDPQAAAEAEPCEVQVMAQDGKTIVIQTTSRSGDPVSAPQPVTVTEADDRGGESVVYRVNVVDGDGKDGKTVERCVIVLSDGEGEPKILRGEEAKAWIEEHGLHTTVEKAQSKQTQVEEIRDAKHAAEAGEHEVIVIEGDKIKHKAKLKSADGRPIEVIVVGPDGAKHVYGGKVVDPDGQAAESGDAQPRFQYRVFGEPGADGQGANGVWRFHKGQQDGQAPDDWKESPDGKTFTFEFGAGHGGAYPKAHGETPGKTHGQTHAAEGPLMHGELFEANGDGARLEDLRRELEKTRAALEEQRKALEELKQMLQKQREKTDTVGAWGR